MKYLLISIIFILVFTGCSNKYGEPVGPYPVTEENIKARFITEGWGAYNKGDFELASSYFDSLVEIEADNPDGYLGLGWSHSQLDMYDNAISDFSFVIFLEGSKPVEKDKSGKAFFTAFLPDSSGYVIAPEHSPVMGFLDTLVDISPAVRCDTDTVYVQGTDTVYVIRKTEYEKATVPLIRRFSPTSFIACSTSVPRSVRIDTFIFDSLVGSEVLSPDTVYFVPNSDDTFSIPYAYYAGGETWKQGCAFAGMSQTYALEGITEEEYPLSIVYANALIEAFGDTFTYYHLDTTVTVDSINDSTVSTVVDTNLYYYVPEITSRNVRILLAQTYWNLKFYMNALWEVWVLDPDTKDPGSAEYIDPDASTFVTDLLRKINEIQTERR